MLQQFGIHIVEIAVVSFTFGVITGGVVFGAVFSFGRK